MKKILFIICLLVSSVTQAKTIDEYYSEEQQTRINKAEERRQKLIREIKARGENASVSPLWISDYPKKVPTDCERAYQAAFGDFPDEYFTKTPKEQMAFCLEEYQKKDIEADERAQAERDAKSSWVIRVVKFIFAPAPLKLS